MITVVYKRFLRVLALVSIITLSLQAGDRYTVNKTRAIIYHPEGTAWVLQSDLRPALDGSLRNLERAVFEKLIVFEAQKYKVVVSEAEIDKRLADIHKQLEVRRPGITMQDIFKEFEKMGIPQEEIREELRTTHIVEMMIEQRVKSKVLVSNKDVEHYADEHPVLQVKQLFIPYSTNSLKALQKTKIEDSIESQEILKAPNWSDTLELNLEDLAQDKLYIKDLTAGSIQVLTDTPEGVTVLHFIGKKPLDKEREKTIMYQLHGERLDKALADYNKELLKTARIKEL
ncbi:hypothetical protein H0X48_06485 [Candidatus Dependentiae bacterium]|nr:hypothetical protein [Candidatus Dependentiae bacterium]